MADDTNIEDKKVKDGSIFFSYLVVVLFLAVLAVLIVMKALNTAFVEKDRWLALAKTQIMPDRTVLPSRGNIYSFDGKLMATSVPRYYTYLDFKADGFPDCRFMKVSRSTALALTPLTAGTVICRTSIVMPGDTAYTSQAETQAKNEAIKDLMFMIKESFRLCQS